MEPDKRRFVRKRTNQLLYAELGPDNGSILLNLCEEGCSFQSIAPVRDARVRFTVSVGDGCKLEGDGQMIWSDTAKRTGGLRFLNPSRELQEQVREWMGQTLVTADGRVDPAAMDSQAKRRRKELREEARAAARVARKEGAKKTTRTEADAKLGGQTPRMSAAETNAAAVQVVSHAWAAHDSTSQVKPAGTWRGVVRIVLAALLLIVLIVYRRDLGHLLMSFGSSIAGEEQKAKTGAPPAEVQAVPEQAGADVKPAALSEGKDSSSESDTAADAGPVSKEQIAPSTNVPTVPAKRNTSQQTSASDDVSSLWTSVENGDTRAEVLLANRYLRGEGVPQSCAQARVLLEAAVKRGSMEAQQKLDELIKGGCP
jgi:TPR repeat protein